MPHQDGIVVRDTERTVVGEQVHEGRALVGGAASREAHREEVHGFEKGVCLFVDFRARVFDPTDMGEGLAASTDGGQAVPAQPRKHAQGAVGTAGKGIEFFEPPVRAALIEPEDHVHRRVSVRIHRHDRGILTAADDRSDVRGPNR